MWEVSIVKLKNLGIKIMGLIEVSGSPSFSLPNPIPESITH